MPVFSERLSGLRKEKGLSQADLGRIFKLGQSTIAMYETGKREPDMATIKQFAEYFRCSTDYILGYSDTRELSRELSEQQYCLLRERNLSYNENSLPPVFDDLDPETIKILNRADKLTPRAKEQLKEAIKWVFELDAKERELQNYKSNIIELPTEKTGEKGE